MVLLNSKYKSCADYSRKFVKALSNISWPRCAKHARAWKFLLLRHYVKQILPLKVVCTLLCLLLTVYVKQWEVWLAMLSNTTKLASGTEPWYELICILKVMHGKSISGHCYI